MVFLAHTRSRPCERISVPSGGAPEGFPLKKRRSAEQILSLLRRAELDLRKGISVPDVCRRLSISQPTYYRWRKKFSESDSREAYHHGDLRNAMIATAVRMIAEGGEAAFSLREAAREVGVSANAAYRHFEDKSALLTAAAAGGLEQLANRMLKAMNQATKSESAAQAAIARFKAVGRAYVEFAMTQPELFRLMFSGSGVACLASAAASLTTPTPWELLNRSLDSLAADGPLPADRRNGAELNAWSVVHGFAMLAIADHSRFPTGQERHAALEKALDFTVLGLCAPALA